MRTSAWGIATIAFHIGSVFHPSVQSRYARTFPAESIDRDQW